MSSHLTHSPATVCHSVFGLLVVSNLAVPGLPILTTTSAAADLQLFLGADILAGVELPVGSEEILYVSAYSGPQGQPALRIWKMGDDFLHMEYYDGVQFWLDRRGTRVWCTWNPPLAIEDIATYLLGPVLGLLLRLRGMICLHASAVAFGDRAVAFVGSEGAGKSTTAAALARRNHTVLSDDVVALTETDKRFEVLPAYPYLSLWSDSAELLFGRDSALPSFSPHYDKKQLLLRDKGLAFASRSLPLGAIFLLADRTADESAPWLEAITPRQSMVRLIADSYATNLLDPAMRAREFELLGRLLAAIPVSRLHPHQQPSRINALCELIESHCRGLGLNSGGR